MRVVILGAGISGHTAALLLRKKLPREHEVVVVTPNKNWNWIPSNIWVGVGAMAPNDVTFELKPVYDKMGIKLIQGKALKIYPEGSAEIAKPFVSFESTVSGDAPDEQKIEYDFLINATGPKLNFAATPGLGPEGHTLSVCTYHHADQAAKKLKDCIDEMKRGKTQTFLVGTGHGTCTCQGAAFEYIFNLEFEINKAGVRDLARLIYITNESELGDFGVGGMHLKRGGYVTQSKIFAESLFAERNVKWITGAAVKTVEEGKVLFETIDGEERELSFDFAMLIPPFGGVGLKAFNRNEDDITSQLFAPNGFMKVDADYTPKPFDQWEAKDWPATYQTKYGNIFAIGIAFAPPHQISKPRKSPNGTIIAPAPPRTGMPSAIMGRAVAGSIADMILTGSNKPTRAASMAEMGAACVASAGKGIFNGSAVSMTMFPVVPDFEKYPGVGRDLTHTTGEIGLAGHWIKHLLHYAFMYKAKAYPFWWIIPE